jgi:NAD+ synthase (glutamine-hydrolysing)
MLEVASNSKDITVIVGFVDQEASIYNAAAVAHNGKLIGKYHKIHLPNYGVFDEHRYFKPGFLCPVFIIDGIRIGVNICEDIWYDIGPTPIQKDAGAEIIINLNASPYSANKLAVRENILSQRALDSQLYISYTNLVGGQDELVFDGGSMVFGPNGKLIARGKQFTEDMVVVDIDLDDKNTDMKATSIAKTKQESLAKIGIPNIINISERQAPRTKSRPLIKPAITQSLDHLSEIYSALLIGTRDYVQKCGFEKVVIGLSGGIDSSLTAVLAADALGSNNVKGVSMPSRYSSEGSVSDAYRLADNLGIEVLTIPIEETFTAILNTLSQAFGDSPQNVAEENLQTRIRGNILMGLSNKFGWLVLTTGNKSEYATGYSTLYGDMAGGFAVIKDVPKTLVYQLATHRNASATEPTSPIPQTIIEKAPSAELKPNQLDQDTLPSYEILDSMLEAYVENDMSPAEISAMGFDMETVKDVIRMVDRNEYKRRQSPPGIKITPRAFGRDRRLPIVNLYKPS